MHAYPVFRRGSTPVQLLGNVFVSHPPMDIYRSWLKKRLWYNSQKMGLRYRYNNRINSRNIHSSCPALRLNVPCVMTMMTMMTVHDRENLHAHALVPRHFLCTHPSDHELGQRTLKSFQSAENQQGGSHPRCQRASLCGLVVA